MVKHLSRFLKKRVRGCRLISLTYISTIDDKPLAVLRAWLQHDTQDNRIPFASVVFDLVEVSCTSRDKGFAYFDLEDPNSMQDVLKWMQKVGVTSKSRKWTEPE